MFYLNSSVWKRAEYCWVLSTSTLYFGGPVFKPQQGDELSWLRIFHGFIHSLQK
jgi:hypothetical protein